jgi:hypothetical protein
MRGPDPSNSCPFYGAALSFAGEMHPRLIAIETHDNQCALITSKPAPCWMEVSDHRTPAWDSCPRNPEFLAIVPADQNSDGRDRIVAHFRHLERMLLVRRREQ